MDTDWKEIAGLRLEELRLNQRANARKRKALRQCHYAYYLMHRWLNIHMNDERKIREMRERERQLETLAKDLAMLVRRAGRYSVEDASRHAETMCIRAGVTPRLVKPGPSEVRDINRKTMEPTHD